jgi:tetratricopeptide (TPR) repeat protein
MRPVRRELPPLGRWLLLALFLASSPAIVHAKASKGLSVTEQDLRVCMGYAGAEAEQQVATCTRILKSGKVKPPHHSEYLAYRAGAYMALKKSSLALADLNAAIAVRDREEFRFQRALVHMARGTLDEAGVDLDAVVRMKPAFAPAYYMRGAIAFRRGDYALARSEFDAAAQKLPTYYQAIYARGVAKAKAGDPAGGKEDMDVARGMSDRVGEDVALMGIK